MEHWYALNTKPHQERRVAAHLRRRRLEVCLPLVRVNPVNPRAARERPYFPGYLFVQLDWLTAGGSAIQWTPGLRRLVEFDGTPGIVPDAFIAELRRRLAQISAAGGLAFDDLHPGDRVRITTGPLAGYEAVFDMRLSGSVRVRVLLEMMRQAYTPARAAARRFHPAAGGLPRQVPVELEAAYIEKVKTHAQGG